MITASDGGGRVMVKGAQLCRKDIHMGNLVLNLSDVDEKAGGFSLLDRGMYEAVIDDVTFGDSSKGSPMLTWKFKITAGTPDDKAHSLFWYTVLDQPFGLANLKKALIAIGLEEKMDEFDPEAFADEGDAIGLPIQVKVGIQKYEGEKRNTVKDIAASTEGGNGFMD